MADDDLLREAQDPTTSPQRLNDLWSKVRTSGPARPDVEQAIMANPNVPFWLLSAAMTTANSPRNITHLRVAAWRNPSVPLLLLSEPRPEYEGNALLLLHRLSRLEPHPDGALASDLAHAVGAWAACEADERSLSRAFAQHLAGLFGLPWTSP